MRVPLPRQVEKVFLKVQQGLEECVKMRTQDLSLAIEALEAEALQRRKAQLARDKAVRLLVNAEENQRRRISLEIHDTMGQYLTALGLEIKALQPFLGRSSAAAKKLRRVQALVAQAGKEAHRIALDLRPSALDDFGLQKTLKDYLEDWSQTTQVSVDSHLDGLSSLNLPSEVEITLYRFVQEALTNVAKHSGATRVALVMKLNDGQLVGIIEDNGKGLSRKKRRNGSLNHSSGLGLEGMKERLLLLDGEMEIESSDRGTSVFVRLPLSSSQRKKQHV